MIDFKKICANDIKELMDLNTIYISDFRSLGESFFYDIPSMWKYENLLPWIVKNGYCSINENVQVLKPSNDNIQYILCKKDKDSTKSIVKRIPNNFSFLNIKKIWTAVPHPEIDILAKEKKLELNYSYSDFLILNDKIKCKILLKDLTPEWFPIMSWIDLLNFWEKKEYVIKRKNGSGGYTVFFPNEDTPPTKLSELFNEDKDSWYAEKITNGKPMSVQCYKHNQDVIIFGIAEQIIENKSEFIGAKLMPLTAIQKFKGLSMNLQNTLEKLSDHLSSYNGFLGIDFLYDNVLESFSFLESNIRLTAVSVPTLLFNNTNNKSALFYEDYKEIYKKPDKLLLYDDYWDCWDVLKFMK